MNILGRNSELNSHQKGIVGNFEPVPFYVELGKGQFVIHQVKYSSFSKLMRTKKYALAQFLDTLLIGHTLLDYD